MVFPGFQKIEVLTKRILIEISDNPKVQGHVSMANVVGHYSHIGAIFARRDVWLCPIGQYQTVFIIGYL